MKKRYKSESTLFDALEYLSVYDWVILISIIAIVGFYLNGSFNGFLGNTECITVNGFICKNASFSTSGYLNIQLGQATGKTLYVTGIACADKQSIQGLPLYGNLNVVGGSGTLGSAEANGAPMYKTVLSSQNSYIATRKIIFNSGSVINFTIPCYSNNNSIIMPAGSIFNGSVWLNYSYNNLSSYNLAKVTSGLVQRAVQNPAVGFAIYQTNSTYVKTFAPQGYAQYICAISASFGPITNYSGSMVSNASYYSVQDAVITQQSSNTCSGSVMNNNYTSNQELDIGAVGISNSAYTVYTYHANTGDYYSHKLDYSVAQKDSYVLILGSSGYYGIITSASNLPSGCNYLTSTKSILNAVVIIGCSNQTIGNYNVTLHTGYTNIKEPAGIAIAAYVFKPE